MNIKLIGESARQAARSLALVTSEEKVKALRMMADAIHRHESDIISANQIDMNAAKQKGLPTSFLDRLMLDAKRIEAMASGLEAIAGLPDPIGTILAEIERPNKLEIDRVRVPIGVIGVIYESRPNVTADAAGLCLKSGNAVILRGGSESFHSATAIMIALHEGIAKTNLPIHAIQMIPTTDRAAVDDMLKMDKYIDVIIPRGGMQLIKYISSQTRIPLFKHLAGICHTYIHQAADKEMARKIVLNAKMRRTGICGATETLLVDKAAMMSHLPAILEDLIQAGCEIRGDDEVVKLNPKVKHANAQDFDTEFLDAIIAVKIVSDISEAIAHIAQHGTQHTDAIITQDEAVAAKFLKEVDSAIVMHNTSTQFADGGEFGMGAEIGISTGKLHARGPVGVEQLTTFKYVVRGSGQVR
jgi:glutamate-5-semialdehyde dehydrogenase